MPKGLKLCTCKALINNPPYIVNIPSLAKSDCPGMHLRSIRSRIYSGTERDQCLAERIFHGARP